MLYYVEYICTCGAGTSLGEYGKQEPWKLNKFPHQFSPVTMLIPWHLLRQNGLDRSYEVEINYPVSDALSYLDGHKVRILPHNGITLCRTKERTSWSQFE